MASEIQKNTSEYVNLIYARLMDGNGRIHLSRRVQSDFTTLAQKGKLTHDSGKDVIAGYVRAAIKELVSRGNPQGQGQLMASVFNRVTNRIYTEFKPLVQEIKQQVKAEKEKEIPYRSHFRY